MYFDWFYSDPHFGHKAIIDYCNRPFYSVEQMTEVLIANFNKYVSHGDNVLWLGDCFFMKDEEAKKILKRLRGTHFLVCGNHDRNSRRMVDIGFSFAVKQIVWKQAKVTFRGSHFPWDRQRLDDNREYLLRWHPKYKKDECLVHGHTHSSHQHNGGNAIHCGVDAWQYRPVAFHEALHHLRKNGVAQ